MNLRKLKAMSLNRKKPKRVGRGRGSGRGKTCGRGHKGAHARSGWGGMRAHEGGQTPLFRRLPKRGFKNTRFAVKYAIVNVGDLNSFPAGTDVTPELLLQERKVRKIADGVKILGGGALEVPLTVRAHKFSASAEAKIKDAGGETTVLAGADATPADAER
jgi:large subunit ribosomal protein L15